METNENINIQQLKLHLIEQILAIASVDILQKISEKVIDTLHSEKSNTNDFSGNFTIVKSNPNSVIKPYITENDLILKDLRNKPTRMYQNIDDLPNYDENLLNEEKSVGLAKTLQNIGNLFDDEPPLEELLKDLTA